MMCHLISERIVKNENPSMSKEEIDTFINLVCFLIVFLTVLVHLLADYIKYKKCL